ncbi:MAG: NAD(P)H-hydrate dehydratase, partial [Lachnospiraceae bacterium]|nr:NAD(P)H-hydrate dehydratase [Lachnospiraceae bacterium]
QEDPARQRVLVFSGGGGNGGDGIAVARILHQRGAEVLLVTVGEIDGYREIAKKQLEIAMRYGVPLIRLGDPGDTEAVRLITKLRFDVIVDALFGIGVTRPLSGVWSAAVALIRELKAASGDRIRILSIDLPSGIHTDTGEVCGIAVRADVTVTMNYRKAGITLYPGADLAGKVRVVDVGITPESFGEEMPLLAALNEDPREGIPARVPSANKGGFGKVLIIAGNGNVGGAPILAAGAAFAAGVGMVRVFTEQKNRTALLSTCPEALIDTWDEEAPIGRMNETLKSALAWATACVIGPGIGTDERALELLRVVLEDGRLPLVIDADGCNLIARHAELKSAVRTYRQEERWPILTPHVGEFARLSGLDIPAVKREFFTAPKKLAEELSCTILCKDARSVTAQAGRKTQILNLTGNSGMATAGSGDVLAGIVGALAAQGMQPYDAAAVGAYLHGAAGDAAASVTGEASLTASELVRHMGEILR